MKTTRHRRVFSALALSQLLALAAAQDLVGPPETLWAEPSRAVAAADIDGDGDIDLVVSDGIAELRVLENLGAGAFSVGRAQATSGPRVLALGDLDGDRAPDLVVCDSFAAQVSVQLNDGHGQFGAPTSYRSVLNPNDVELVDLDGDRRSELVIAGALDMVVLRNAGDGSFLRAVPLEPDICRYEELVSLDADQDGDVELVVSGGAGVFSFECCGALRVLDQAGGALMQGPAHLEASCHEALAAGDLDGDGDTDLAVAYGEGFLVGYSVLLNDGSGSFSLGWDISNLDTPPSALDLTDLDGDGDLDQVGGDRAWLNDGFGAFGSGSVDLVEGPGFQASAFGQAVADVDGDGDEDIILATNDGLLLLRSLAADDL